MFRVSWFAFASFRLSPECLLTPLRAGVLALLLGGCASVAPPLEPPAARLPLNHADFNITGRIAVQYDGQAFSGGLRWRHTADADDILLSSPLGQGMARIVRDPSGVTLVGADRQAYHAQDAEALTEAVLGWRLPLAGMMYWVRGKPAPGASQTRHEAGRLVRLEQDGWQIDYPGYGMANNEALPQKIFLQRGDLDIRLVIDAWSAP